jgi:deoxyhypusine synthase
MPMPESRSQFLQTPVKAIEVSPKSISALLEAMADTGFQGRSLAEAVRVWEQMIADPDVTIALGYAGSLSTTGQWKLITWLLEQRYVDILVATGANLSEDIVEAMGKSYWKGSHLADDVELLNQDVNRYYDVYGSEIDYMEMTELIAQFYLEDLTSGVAYSSREILHRFGLWLSAKGIDSIVAVAAKAGVPVFCPAIVDSPYGDAGLIAKSKDFNLVIDNMKDYTEFMSVGERVKDTGVVYIGGGVPKDFIQLLAVTSNLLYKERVIPNRAPSVFRARHGDQDELVETYYPHKYAVQVTTDAPHWGGLSGCTFEEATSWGKEQVNAPKAQCFCDATIALPIITHALNERITQKRKGTDFAWLFA